MDTIRTQEVQMPYLNDSVVRNLPVPEKTHYHITYDSGPKRVPGFGVRVTEAGYRSFILNYPGGRYTIGRFGDWSTGDARQEAKRLRREIDLGADPMRDRKAEREAPTITDLVQRVEAEHLPRLRPATAASIRAQLKNHVLPALGESTKVADVRFEDIDRLHRRVTKAAGPYGANRVLALCSKMFSLAVRWQMRADNPCRGVERNREHSRQRYLTADEMAALTQALAEFPDRDMADIFRMLLLTGARKGEVLRMKWDDVDITAGTWTKPPASTKQNRVHVVPLSAPARQLLGERLMNKRSDYVFPSDRGCGPILNIHHAWKRLTKGAGIDGVRVHDLRHSFASSIASSGGSLPLIGALLGHSSPATTHRYAHLFDDAQRAAVERVGGTIVNAGKPAVAAVPIGARGRR